MIVNHYFKFQLLIIDNLNLGRFNTLKQIMLNFFLSNYFSDVNDSNRLILGPDPDDVLDENETDGNGNFNLEGSTREMTSIDPVLKIYHDCDDGLAVSDLYF